MNSKRVAEFFDKIMDKNIEDVIVSKKDNGYVLFGRFYVSQQKPNWYEVIDVTFNEVVEFSTLKYAIAWASLVNCKQHHLARRLAKLDLKLNSLNLDLQATKHLYRIHEEKEIYWLKFHDTNYNRKLAQHEINELVHIAKTKQNHKFSTDAASKKFRYWG